MLSLQAPHLTYNPSGTRLSCSVGGSASCSRRNQANSVRRGVLLLRDVVLDSENLARARVDLLGGFLCVLELGQLLLDFRQLGLDLAVELADLLARHVERRLEELGLLLREGHRCHLRACVI